jgi:hypothetical protein
MMQKAIEYEIKFGKDAQVERRANFDLGHRRTRTRTGWQGGHFAGYATESAKPMTALENARGQATEWYEYRRWFDRRQGIFGLE